MRLLSLDDDGVFYLTEHRTSPPAYAVLSHKWAEDEVTFDDINNGIATSKAGYHKIKLCMNKAREDGLHHIWLDTCCINKNNDAELSRSITSMFRWYAESQCCYVHLADVSVMGTKNVNEDLQAQIAASLWFTRGWTLQELLAPSLVKFFDSTGESLGTKIELASTIHAVTGIDAETLAGKPLERCTVQERFMWASRRETTEPEDSAYCLLGIFDVSLAIIYGEGATKAFDRLKECISRKFEVELMKLDVYAAKTSQNLSMMSLSKEAGNSSDFSIAQLAQQSLDAPKRRRAAIIRHLRFDAMETRRAIINEPLSGTCGWILADEAFNSWRTHQETFIWIKGHPGAGKSTLMKFVDYTMSAEDNSVLISFYFNARGEYLERSVVGLYRSLVVQLLRLGKVELVLDKLAFQRPKVPEPDFFREPSIAVLREILAACIAALDVQVWCIIDALDETSPEDVLEMVDYLGRLDGGRLSVCLASRHYPTLDLPVGLQIVLDHDPGHYQDVESYVGAKLHARADTKIRAEIAEKANGIFMWVVLVVGMLNKEYRTGSMLRVRKRLRELPSGLIDLLGTIARQDDVPNNDFILCLHWILYAQRPLVLSELYHAMHMGLGDGVDVEDVEELMAQELQVSSEDMERFLVTYSKGMAEVSREFGRIQFIHESIRDFLLRYKGMQMLCGSEIDTTEHAAHRRLALCCCRSYGMRIKLRGFPPESDDLWFARLELAKLPLLEYTLAYVKSHIRLGNDAQIQETFERDFENELWEAWIVFARLNRAEVADEGWLVKYFRALDAATLPRYFHMAQTYHADILRAISYELEDTQFHSIEYAKTVLGVVIKWKPASKLTRNEWRECESDRSRFTFVSDDGEGLMSAELDSTPTDLSGCGRAILGVVFKNELTVIDQQSTVL